MTINYDDGEDHDDENICVCIKCISLALLEGTRNKPVDNEPGTPPWRTTRCKALPTRLTNTLNTELNPPSSLKPTLN